MYSKAVREKVIMGTLRLQGMDQPWNRKDLETLCEVSV